MYVRTFVYNKDVDRLLTMNDQCVKYTRNCWIGDKNN